MSSGTSCPDWFSAVTTLGSRKASVRAASSLRRTASGMLRGATAAAHTAMSKGTSASVSTGSWGAKGLRLRAATLWACKLPLAAPRKASVMGSKAV